MKNLDYEPGFWLTVLILLPFAVYVEIGCRIRDARERRKNSTAN